MACNRDIFTILYHKIHCARNYWYACSQPPVPVAESSKALTVLAPLDAGIVVSNPTRGIDVYVYVYVYSMFVLSCVGRGLAMS
jgi:hypothetical protein